MPGATTKRGGEITNKLYQRGYGYEEDRYAADTVKWAEDEEDPLKTAGGRAYGGLNGGPGRHFRADLSAVEAVAELTDQALNAESDLILKGNVTQVRHGDRRLFVHSRLE